MKKNQLRKWSHFIDETGKKHQSAQIEGYAFGDRLLEDVWFIITIQKDGSLKASTRKDCKDYMSELNEKKWLKEAIAYCEHGDFYESSTTDLKEYKELDLINESGKSSHQKQSKGKPIKIQNVKAASIGMLGGISGLGL